MAFTTAAEITFINQVFDRISAGQITLAVQTSVEATSSFRHWTTTINSLVRSFEWPFLTTRDELYYSKTLSLDTQPNTAFAVDDTLTGISSDNTGIVSVATSDTEYEIDRLTGDFEDGETITNATVHDVYWHGVKVQSSSEDVVWFDKTATATYMTVSNVTLAVAAPSHQWTYKYRLPSDFARLIDVYEDDGTDEVDERWTREGDYILTDYTTCNIRYVKTVTDPDDFDPLFKEVLILRLAWKLIPILAGNMSQVNREEIKKELQQAEAKARTVCAQENNQTGRADFQLARFDS